MIEPSTSGEAALQSGLQRIEDFPFGQMKAHPLSPFEHYMLADDRADFAMVVYTKAEFRGELDRAAFEAAVKQSLRHHPLFQAVLKGHPSSLTSRLAWLEYPGFRMPEIHWAQDDEPLLPAEGDQDFDLSREIGLRLFVRTHGGRSTVSLQYHHAICDGKGSFVFLEDVLRHYDALIHASSTEVTPRADRALVVRRDDFGLTPADRRERLGRDLRRTLKFFKVQPSPLAPPRSRRRRWGSRRRDPFAHVACTIDTDALREIEQYASRTGATVNDVLLASLFRGLDRWNQSQRGRFSWRRRIRLAMPTCLRDGHDERLGACNKVSMVFLDASPTEIARADEHLAAIVTETRDIKLHRMGLTLIRVVETLGRLGLLKPFMRLPLCSTTAVLTNLGRPFRDSTLASNDGLVRAGGAVLEQVAVLPPLRPKTRVALSANRYGNALSLSLRYDDVLYDRHHADEILGLIVADLTERTKAGNETEPCQI